MVNDILKAAILAGWKLPGGTPGTAHGPNNSLKLLIKLRWHGSC